MSDCLNHLVCDPTPSEDVGASFVLRLKAPASLWRFDDEDVGAGTCVRMFGDLPDLGGIDQAKSLARVAREVGDFWVDYLKEVDDE